MCLSNRRDYYKKFIDLDWQTVFKLVRQLPENEIMLALTFAAEPGGC